MKIQIYYLVFAFNSGHMSAPGHVMVVSKDSEEAMLLISEYCKVCGAKWHSILRSSDEIPKPCNKIIGILGDVERVEEVTRD